MNDPRAHRCRFRSRRASGAARLATPLVGGWLLGLLAGCGPASDEPGAPLEAAAEANEEALRCLPRTRPIDPRRSLFVTDLATLRAADFSLARTLDLLARQVAAPNLTGLDLFRQLWDTQNPGPGLKLGPHCDDARLVGGGAALNGFPLRCGRAEGAQADAALDPRGLAPETYLRAYQAIALVNRFDLAPPSGAHCGEYRIVYAKDPDVGPGRNLIIFEAVLPNPNPECGLAACRPVQALWASLSDQADPGVRAQQLERFFYAGIGGFAPAIHYRHFLLGGAATGQDAGTTGQIRTNQFMQVPWVLREYQLRHVTASRRRAADLDFVPVELKNNPAAVLFDPTLPAAGGQHAATAADFQGAFLEQVGPLSSGPISAISMSTRPSHEAGESEAPRTDTRARYTWQFTRDGGRSAFRDALATRLGEQGSSLTPAELVARAQTQSCAGCHQLSNGDPLGGGLTWPASLGFVHTDEANSESSAEGPRFRISPALATEFLPTRLEIMTTYLASSDCRRCGRVRFRMTRDPSEEAAAQSGVRLARGNPVH
jgi:hypothetical protein